MSDEESQCYFPPCSVSRVGNVVMIHCESEDDAIVVFEIFREVALGRPVWIAKADGPEG